MKKKLQKCMAGILALTLPLTMGTLSEAKKVKNEVKLSTKKLTVSKGDKGTVTIKCTGKYKFKKAKIVTVSKKNIASVKIKKNKIVISGKKTGDASIKVKVTYKSGKKTKNTTLKFSVKVKKPTTQKENTSTVATSTPKPTAKPTVKPTEKPAANPTNKPNDEQQEETATKLSNFDLVSKSDGTYKLVGLSAEGKIAAKTNQLKRVYLAAKYDSKGEPKTIQKMDDDILEQDIVISEIADEAFTDVDEIQSVELPDSVTEIGDDAFAKMDQLEEVELPDSLEEMGNNVFSETPWVAQVPPEEDFRISNGVLVAISEDIKNETENVVIPEGVTEIASSVFSTAKAPVYTLPSTLKRIDGYAFAKNRNITSIVIPEGVTTLGDGVFEGCSNLENITIPESVTRFGQNPFGYDSKWFLDQVEKSANNIVIINKVVINGEYASGDVELSDDIIGIAPRAFAANQPGHNNVTSITVPANLEYIGDNALTGNCAGMTTLNFGSKLEEIGANIVSSRNCKINIGEDNPFLKSEEGMVFSKDRKILYYANSAIADVLQDNENFLNGVEVIESYACSNLTIPKLNLPQSLAHIELGAFYNVSGLAEVNIPMNTTYVSTNAFTSCSSLQKVVFEGTENSDKLVVGTAVFSYCEQLKDVTLSANMKELSMWMFENTGIESLTVPASVEVIGWQTFANSKLASITLPEGVQYIMGPAFSKCPLLESITLPKSLIGVWDKGIPEMTIIHDSGDGDDSGEKATKAILKVYKDSFAEEYARQRQLTYENID